jgi:caa(3)-type oxidase subunit IV
MATTPDLSAPGHPGATSDVVAPDAHDHDVDRNKLYVLVAVILAAMTALEVATYWMPKDIQHSPFFAVALCGLMAVKFVTVTLFFMHLKFDKRLLTIAFYSALTLAVVVYLVVLTAFRFWWPANQMVGH